MSVRFLLSLSLSLLEANSDRSSRPLAVSIGIGGGPSFSKLSLLQFLLLLLLVLLLLLLLMTDGAWFLLSSIGSLGEIVAISRFPISAVAEFDPFPPARGGDATIFAISPAPIGASRVDWSVWSVRLLCFLWCEND